MAILRKISPLILLMSLTGCYQDFDPYIDTKPVLAINSLITAGEPIEVQLSHTWVYNNVAASEADHSVTDATLLIYVDDILVDENYTAREGDHVRIVADSPKYGHAEAEVTVPLSAEGRILDVIPHIDNIYSYDYDELEMRAEIYFSMDITLEVKDDSERSDWYQLDFSTFCLGNVAPDDYWDPWGENPLMRSVLYMGSLDYDAVPLFSEHIGGVETVMGSGASGFTFFTDRQISGKPYKMYLSFSNACYSVTSDVYDESMFECGYEVRLISVSQSWYNWHNYLWQRNGGTIGDYSDLGLCDPIWGYSNVSTGAGVVAARTITDFTIPLTDFIRDAYNTLE